MADEYQVIYEYTNGNTITFKTDDLRIEQVRSQLRVDTRVDGIRVVTDPGFSHKVFTFSAVRSGDDLDTLDGVQSGAITYSGAYPKIQKIYWDGDTFESNIEVALTSMVELDRGAGWWLMSITMEQKDQ